MAASFRRRVGLPNDLPKFQPTQPAARCLGAFTICCFRTTEGKPIEIASYFQPWALALILETSSFGESVMPESNFRVSRWEIISFTAVPPMSTTRTFFFIATRLRAKLFAEPEFLEEAALLRLPSLGGRRPAFDDLEGEESEEGEPCELEIEPEILRDLRDRANAIELRSELRFRHGETKILDALVTVTGIGRDRARLDFRLAELLELDATQSGERPVIDVLFARNLAGVFRQRFARLEDEPDFVRRPKLRKKLLTVML